MSILIIGGTGFLGREVLKQTIKQCYNIKCLVQNLQRSYWCLKQWGVSFLYGNFVYPSTFPKALFPKFFLDYRSLNDHRSRNLSSDVIDDLQLDKFYEEVLIYNEIDYKQKTTNTINTIIDCVTLKVIIKSDSVNLLEIIDWKRKLALLVTCSIIQLKKLIFFSILNLCYEFHTYQLFKSSLKSLRYLMENLI
uniref:Truncated hypothetical chloroplast RF39 n=1 Tax=Karlodinium veneficum TaxID=407301 RepID=G1E783_KARVE|nr:truncated hypothetical chloroplast RF39 [Karlodinium veneficum]